MSLVYAFLMVSLGLLTLMWVDTLRGDADLACIGTERSVVCGDLVSGNR